MTPPTAEQARALDTIRSLTHGGTPPSYTELQVALGISSRGHLHGLLHRMRDRGLVDFKDGLSRTLRIVGELEGLSARSTDELRRLRDRVDALLRDRGAA